MRVGVVGAGAWGTAFAIHLARQGHQVLLWVYEPDLFQRLKKTRENAMYLPSFSLPRMIDATNDLEMLCHFSDDIVVATPSFALRTTMEKMGSLLSRKRLLLLTKGFEDGTLFRMSEVVREMSGNAHTVAVLSGPSFAKEVAQGVFTSVVISSKDNATAKHFQSIVHSQNFRVYTSEDLTGTEVGGAMKNVMAIGAGIIEGLALGTNTLAAFVTRGLAEIKRLGKAMGAKETTFMGLSGMGDLILTCYGGLSRNRAFGIELSRGQKAIDVIKNQRQVVEGYYTINASHILAQRLAIEMPITDQLYRIIFEDKDLMTAITDITARGLKDEEEG